MVRTIVIIPTISQLDRLRKLVNTIKGDKSVSDIVIYDNGHPEENRMIIKSWMYNPKIKYIEAYKKSIYELWNMGWQYAKQLGTVNVAILNDDIRIMPGTLDMLGEFLRTDPTLAAVCPDYTMKIGDIKREIIPVYVTSTFGHNGLAGFCFMLKAELPIPYIDETFQWWYGDDDLVKQIELAGYKMARIEGIPIEHDHGSSSRLVDQDLLMQKKIADKDYFNKKYGENRQI